MSNYYWSLKVEKRKGYDPSQPRIPAGQSGGGRWASGGSQIRGTDVSRGNINPTTEARVLESLEVALAHGNATGREMSISLDTDGTEIAKHGGERINVPLTPAPIVVHNHPKDMTFAPEDMAEMFKHQGIQHQFLITPDGTIYRLSRTEQTPKNEWPGRVEREYLAIDDRFEGILDFQRTYAAEVGHPITLNEAIFEKHHRVMAEVATIMGLDYERYVNR